MAAHKGAVDYDLLALLVGGVEGDVVKNALHHRGEAARADILDIGVHLDGDVGDSVDRVRGELEIDAFGLHQRDVLPDEAVLWLGKDAAEIVAHERAKLDADRQPALQLGQKVRRLRRMKRAGGDEQHMVGLHRTVFGADRGALDQRQEIALHALAAHIGADALGARADLVDLVEEHDAVVLDVADRFLHGGVVVDQLVRLFRQQDIETVAHGDAARLGALAERLAEHVAQIDHADLAAWHAGNLEGWHAGAGIGDLDLDLAVGALLGIQLRLGLDLFSLGVAHEPDAGFQQIADDLIDVAADIANLGELGGLD